MFAMPILELSLSVFFALAGAAVIFWGIERRQKTATVEKSPERAVYAPTFLFTNKELCDTSNGAERLLTGKLDSMTEWQTLMLVLADDFPELEATLHDLKAEQTIEITGQLSPDLRLLATRFGENLRLSLVGLDTKYAPDILTKLEARTMRQELELLRGIAQSAPQLIWQEDDDGQIVWCNQAYLTFADRARGTTQDDVPIWPADRLFENLAAPDKSSEVAQKSRHSIQLAGEAAEHWFNIISMPGQDGSLHFATDANDQLRSEQAQKAFIQTFAKTFAQLSVGLAIFDRSKHLTMFNPALLEMTGLPVSLLSSRPSIDTILNRLREARRLPEPKDFAQWRNQFTRLLEDSSSGSYQEDWSLPDGQTFRVTGRPHPDGAIAFLFEDITAEISLTRRFRTEIETGQAVLDCLPEAIAVFSPANTLVITNQAYSEMWGGSGKEVAATDLRQALRTWKAGAAPSTAWRSIEAFAGQARERQPILEEISLNNGRQITCNVLPITGGMTMVKFDAKRHAPATRQPRVRVRESLAAKS